MAEINIISIQELKPLPPDTNDVFSFTGIIKSIQKKKCAKDDSNIYYLLQAEDRTDSVQLRYYGKEYINKAYVFNFKVTKHTNEKQRTVYVLEDFTEDLESEYDLFDKDIKVDLLLVRFRLNTLLNSIVNSSIKKLITKTLDKYNKFYSVPAAIKIHHNYKYGLFEHSVNVAYLCSLLIDSNIYNFDLTVNKDILIAGALLHDIGKVECYSLSSDKKSPVITIQIDLADHIALGYYMVKSIADSIDGLTDDIKDHILHIILSHHGLKEKGSPVIPHTIESIIVSNIDSLDSYSKAAIQEIEKLKQKTNLTEYKKALKCSLWNGKYINDNRFQTLNYD